MDASELASAPLLPSGRRSISTLKTIPFSVTLDMSLFIIWAAFTKKACRLILEDGFPSNPAVSPLSEE